MRHTPIGNIVRELPVNLAANGDYTDESGNGFFIRSGAGDITYQPINNQASETVTKTVEAQVYFADPVLCHKIIAATTTATGIYVGYGV